MKKKYNAVIIITVLIFSAAIVSSMELTSDDSTLLLLHLNNNVNDSSNAKNHGTYYNADCSAPGLFKQSCLFNGIDQYVEIPHHSSYQTNKGTIIFSFNPSTLGNRQGLISKDANSYGLGGHFTVQTETDNSVRVLFESTSVTRTAKSDSNTVKQNTWHNVAVTFGPDGFKLYLNGVLMDDDSYNGGFTSNTEPLVIGASTYRSASGNSKPLARFFNGKIDEVAFLNKQLSSQEIQELQNLLNQEEPVIEEQSNETITENNQTEEIIIEEEVETETNETEEEVEIVTPPSPAPSSSGGGGSSSGGGSTTTKKSSGGGGCLTEWLTGPWGECTNGTQSREVYKEVEYCVPPKFTVKPDETQPCTNQISNPELTEQSPETLPSKITGAVIGLSGSNNEKSLAVFAFIILLTSAIFLIKQKN